MNFEAKRCDGALNLSANPRNALRLLRLGIVAIVRKFQRANAKALGDVNRQVSERVRGSSHASKDAKTDCMICLGTLQPLFELPGPSAVGGFVHA